MHTKFWKHGFLYVAISTTLAVGVGVYFYAAIQSEKEQLIQKEVLAVKVLEKTITERFLPIITNLKLLSRLPFIQQGLDSQAPDRWDKLAVQLLPYYQSWEVYDQIRIIDRRGMEVVRIDNGAAAPLITPVSKLQNKSNRYYFQNSIKLSKGEIYLSPLDLNFENGKIEMPYKPVIRIAIPIFDQHEQKYGIIILNYLAASLLQRFHQGHSSSSQSHVRHIGDIQLINSDGYWLYEESEKRSWGFMIKDRSAYSFAKINPDDWGIIASKKSGVLEGKMGILAFQHVYPLGESGHQVDQSSQYSWIILSQIGNDKLAALHEKRWLQAMMVYLTLLIIISLTLRSENLMSRNQKRRAVML